MARFWNTTTTTTSLLFLSFFVFPLRCKYCPVLLPTVTSQQTQCGHFSISVHTYMYKNTKYFLFLYKKRQNNILYKYIYVNSVLSNQIGFMNIFYLEIWCFKGLAVWQEVSTWSDVIRPPPVCLFVYRCWLDVVVVVVGGEQRAPAPLAGPGRQCCPPQANSSNYRKGDGHDLVNRLVQWWCVFVVQEGVHGLWCSEPWIIVLHIKVFL